MALLGCQHFSLTGDHIRVDAAIADCAIITTPEPDFLFRCYSDPVYHLHDRRALGGNGLAQRLDLSVLDSICAAAELVYTNEVVTRALVKQTGGHNGGSMALLRPDGSEYPGSPFTGGGLSGPWVATIDGNDNVWVSNFGAPEARITQLCGARTEAPLSAVRLRVVVPWHGNKMLPVDQSVHSQDDNPDHDQHCGEDAHDQKGLA
jgi:hypothetical protein